MVKIYNDDGICGTDGFNIDILAQVHDSILMQIPVPAVNAVTFENLQGRIYNYVSPDLSYNNRSFKIATDSKMGFNWGGKSKTNPQGMREVQTNADISTLLETLDEQGTE
jgi:hypothetical protein